MTILESVLQVLTSIGTWFSGIMTSMVAMFYSAEGGLTFLGILALIGVGIATILMVVSLIRSFLRFS